jgi:3-deoxy-manno-octulosonate cytidylyltransferase (CMP-KDO synthetase)
MKYKILIPSRMKSSRFPGKPLTLICGKPMLMHVIERCSETVPLSEIYVITESLEIVDFCIKNQFNYILTKEHATGTDRLAEANRILKLDYVINVQGDEPLFNPRDIEVAIKYLYDNEPDLLVGYTPLYSEAEWKDSNTIKLVLNSDQKITYLSRAPIPGNKNKIFTSAYRSVNLYAYSKRALQFYSRTPRNKLEIIEDHELIRFYDSNFKIHGILMSDESIPVDIPSDVNLVEKVLKLKHDL